LTKAELVEIQAGEIPVFTAMQEPILSIVAQTKPPIMADKSNPILSFANDGDGSAGRNFVIHTSPFYINASRTAIKVLNSNISIFYLLSQMNGMKDKYGFNYGFKANRQNLSVVTVDIPLDDQGNFDLPEQIAIASQFSLFTETKNEVTQKYHEIAELNIDVDSTGYSMREFPLSDILNPIKGRSKYTKKYGDIHKGKYPVYSASSNAPLTHIDTFDVEGEYLSWSTNGFAGKVTVLQNQFSINGDRGILLPKVENIDIQYLKYILQPIFRRLAKGRKGDRGTDEFTKLYPSMIADVQIPFPVDERGNISLTAQREIAKSHLMIERYKREILEKLNTLLEQKISY
jgi:type I restriction enzyme S subunit